MSTNPAREAWDAAVEPGACWCHWETDENNVERISLICNHHLRSGAIGEILSSGRILPVDPTPRSRG